MQNLSGTVLKGYELRERIGTGGFGAVYRAHQTTIGREVAIKIILPGFANQPEFIRRFEIEAQIIARLEHPHITPLYDYWRDPQGAYLVMRWLRGGSLREALQNRSFDLRSASLILDQIAGALSLAHRSNVIHRDLKPGNILLDEDGNAYLADFGIAKDLTAVHATTNPDAVVGSLDYISPEQARSEPVTLRTDIYSLGVVLYEMLTGKHPFDNCSSIERLYKHINDPLPEINTFDPAVYDAINDIIQKATAKNPDHRYPDALTLSADFREAVGLNNKSETSTSVVELLTRREQEILGLITDGLANKEIAQRLTITVGTVKWNCTQIFAKLRVRSRVQAIVRARELNLIGRTPTPSPSDVSSSQFPLELENPYKGLRAFQSVDEEDFFGREDVTSKLVRRLDDRFLAVIGPSGSGKSSLVKAGLIPAIWRGELPGSERWFVIDMLPGTHPVDKLEVALLKIAANQAPHLHDQLIRDRRGLLRVADLILPNDGSELLLIIDQFEEVFTLVEDENVRKQFLDLLSTAVSDPRSRVRIVITLRADFYDRPLHYPEFGELVHKHMETVFPLSARGLERAITAPAERLGVRFEPGLVAQMVAEMNYQAGALPLLQYALTELFERREGRLITAKTYQDIGGATGALANRAEQIFAELNEEGQQAAHQIFLRLVTLGEGTEDIRRRTARSELLSIAADSDLVDEVIETYTAYRLITLDHDPANRTPTVELAHEAILREWQRLSAWLDGSRDDIRLQRQLTRLSHEWGQAGKDASFLLSGSRLSQLEDWSKRTILTLTPNERQYLETSIKHREHLELIDKERQERELKLSRQAANRLRYVIAVLVAGILVAFGLSLFALQQRQEAEINAELAEERADYASSIALASAAKSAHLSNNPDQAIALAVAANAGDNAPAFAQNVLYETAFTLSTKRLFQDPLNPASGGIFWVVFNRDDRHLLAFTDNFSSEQDEYIYWDVTTGEIVSRWSPQFEDGKRIQFVVPAPSNRMYALLNTNTTVEIAEMDMKTGDVLRLFEMPEQDFTADTILGEMSPDDRVLVAGTRVTEKEDGTFIQSSLFAWDTSTGKILYQFEIPGSERFDFLNATFSADGQQVAGSTTTGQVVIWDASTGKVIRFFENVYPHWGHSVITPQGIFTMSLDRDAPAITVSLLDSTTGEVLRSRSWGYATATVNYRRDGSDLVYAISWGADPHFITFDTRTWQVTGEYYGHGNTISFFTWNGAGTSLVSASNDSTLRLWNLKNYSETLRLEPVETADGIPVDLDLSADGKLLISSQFRNQPMAWDLEQQKLVWQAGEIQAFFRPTALSPDGRYVAVNSGLDPDSCEPGSALSLLDAATGETLWQVKQDMSNKNGNITFSPDGSKIFTTDWTCTNAVTVWDTETGEQLSQLEGHTKPVVDVAVSPDANWVATGAWDGTAIIRDFSTGTIRHTINLSGMVGTVVFSPDSQQLVTGEDNGNLLLWDVTTGEQIKQFTGHTAAPVYVQFSPDGRYLLSSGRDHNLFVRDLETGEILRQFTLTYIGTMGSPAIFSQDGQSIFLFDETFAIRQIDLLLGESELMQWVKENRYVRDLTCSEQQLYQVEPLCDAS